jgi:hypothetical protein
VRRREAVNRGTFGIAVAESVTHRQHPQLARERNHCLSGSQTAGKVSVLVAADGER